MRCRWSWRILHAVIILQNAHAGPDQIVKLAAIGGPKKYPNRDEYDRNRERDEQVERFHYFIIIFFAGVCASRSAFNTTKAELADMPSPAIQGLNKPSAAAGIASRLYTLAQSRF